jgi:hypothetical protein
LEPLHEQAVGTMRPVLVTLLFGVGVVLPITYVNVPITRSSVRKIRRGFVRVVQLHS